MKTVLIIDQPYCTTAAIQIGFNQIELKGDPFKRKLCENFICIIFKNHCSEICYQKEVFSHEQAQEALEMRFDSER